MGNDGTEDKTAWAGVEAIHLLLNTPMRMGHSVSSCIGDMSYGSIKYSVDVLVRCKHTGTDDAMAPP